MVSLKGRGWEEGVSFVAIPSTPGVTTLCRDTRD